ncbi:MAG: mechanosensitive ion channel domain-containing protein, partial [Acidobacteriota bacterium]
AFSQVIWTLAVFLIYLVARRALTAILQRRVEEIIKQYLLTKTLRTILGIVLVVVLFRIWVGDLSGLAAYFGILSAGLAIALQDPLTNFAGWIFIAVRKPFEVGDRIQIGEHSGDIIDMRLFQFTMIEIGNWVDADQSTGRIIHIPNGWVFKQSIANYAQGFNFIWNEIPVVISFESNWEKAKKLLSDIATHHSPIKSEHAAREIRKAAQKYLIFFQYLTPIVWTSVRDSGVTLTVRYICEPRHRRSSRSAIWEDVLRAFALCNDVDLAYPTTRFYDNVVEGKSSARATPLTQPPAESR